MGSSLRRCEVVSVLGIGGALQGRGLVVRVKSRGEVVMLVAAYIPLVPNVGKQVAVYRTTSERRANSVCHALNVAPKSCTPILGCDLNDGIGFSQHSNGEWHEVDIDCVSWHATRRERVSGGAGALLRPILDYHDMESISSYRDSRDTCSGLRTVVLSIISLFLGHCCSILGRRVLWWEWGGSFRLYVSLNLRTIYRFMLFSNNVCLMLCERVSECE